MGTISTVVFVLGGLFALAIFLVVLVFVVFGAFKLIKNKKDLEKVNPFDGLDANELKIIAGAILKKKQADEEVRVRTDAVEALKV